ncbi:elongation factor EF-2 [Halobacteriales archaeon QS_4_66_20]|nr:MAG: elongation factor EF-2 [Halobacteriales archaeon QS_4_66_20]
MDKPENIRNIAIAAHVDHGKCIRGDARISLADGRVVEAEELFAEIRADGEPAPDEGEAYTPSKTVEVASFDREASETVAGEIDYACRRTADEPLVTVRTSNGHEVATTPEHRYLVLTDAGVMEFERSDELEPGDTIVGIRKTPNRTQDRVEADLLRRLAADYGFYVRVTEEFNDRIDAHDRAELREAADSRLKPDSFDHAVWRGQYRLRDVVNVCEAFDIDLADLYANVESLNYRGTDQRGEHSSLDVDLPEDLEPLFYLAGVFFGDGDTEGNITANAAEMKATVERHAAELGLDPIVREFEGRGDRIEIGGKTLASVLQAAFDYPRTDKSASIRIPEVVFRAGRAETAAFVRGYVDADGTVEDSRSAVSVSSVSTGMLADLQLLLYQFDVASKLNRTNDTLYVSGALSLENFAEIGFGLPTKQERFESLLASAAAADVDRVPITGETLREIRADLGSTQTEVFPSYGTYERDEATPTKLSLSRIADRFEELDDGDDIRVSRLQGLANADTSFVEVESIDREGCEYVYDFGVADHHNFVCEGVVVHNTTLTDNLLAGAGMISDETAGEQLAMDTEEDEQERGITIDAANVSMTHEYEGTNHLINLIDTPGHVDFGGDVTRAMRAVDGALVVVDAVEGAMPQTETVLRQALREGVKPTLFINKVDRLISELQEGPQEMQERMTAVIRDVNELIRGMTEEMEDIDDDWTVSVEDGTVGFGSALYKWGVSFPSMQRTGMDFGDIIELERADKRQELAERTPLADVVLDMVCEHFPNPVDAQPRRIPRIWRGDSDSDVAETMRLVDEGGEIVFMVTDISMDPHAGEIATGRVFSGTLEKGQELYVSGTAGKNRLQSVGIFMGGEREEVDRVPAGNVAAVTGLNDAIAGSTVSSVEMTPFESIEHISEPVITKSVEAKNMDDLPKLIETLQQVAKEDPTIEIEINEDTGEHLISGQGELHLEVVTQRIERNQGIPVTTGEPIVVFREAPQAESREVEGISPNRHNRFYMTVQPLDGDVVEAITRGKATMDMPELERREALQEAGLEKETSQDVEHIHGSNIIVDKTKGIQHLNETMELVIEGMEEALNDGPLANEPVQGSLIRLHDARLHEDAIHRGPAQVIPAVRNSLHNALIDAEVRLLEPIQEVRIDVPNEHMGAASGEVQGRRGRVDDMYQEGDLMVVEGVAPVEEMIGFSSDIRSATEGRASWNTENAGFQVMADNLQREKIMEIRERKGMKLELPETVDYF